MAKYTGTLASVAAWTNRADQIKDLLNTYLSDVFVLSADSGTGNTRYLEYEIPGNTRKIRFLYASSYIALHLRSLDNASGLYIVNTLAHAVNAITYNIVKNSASGAFWLMGTGNNLNTFWSAVGSDAVFSCFLTLYKKTADAALTSISSGTLTYTGKLNNGKSIFLPVFAKTDDSLTYYNGVLADVFSVSHGQADATIFNADGVEYMALSSALAIRVN